jgi:hypothetical protein
MMWDQLCEHSYALGGDLIDELLLPRLKELTTNRTWRTRRLGLRRIVLVASHVGERLPGSFTSLLLTLLGDQTAVIRRYAADSVLVITEHCGNSWLHEFVLPHLLSCLTRSYHQRQVTLHALCRLSDVVEPSTLIESIVPAIMGASNDPIAIVRLQVARALSYLLKGNRLSDEMLDAKIKPCLQVLAEDVDMGKRMRGRRSGERGREREVKGEGGGRERERERERESLWHSCCVLHGTLFLTISSIASADVQYFAFEALAKAGDATP